MTDALDRKLNAQYQAAWRRRHPDLERQQQRVQQERRRLARLRAGPILSPAESGRRGGLATLAHHGPDYFSELGKRGAAARRAS